MNNNNEHDIDLNINNYDMNGILNLFNLDIHFTSTDLKTVYKKVLMTHPDKSGLDSSYFLFFTKAFKILKTLYIHIQKSNQQFINDSSCVSRKDYKENVNELSREEKKKQLSFMSKFKSNEHFLEWFNNKWDEVNKEFEEDDDGYGDWMKNEDEVINVNNLSEMNEYINKKKTQIRELVVYNDIEDMNSNTLQGQSFLSKKEQHKNGYAYQGNMFSSNKSSNSQLVYDDLKKVHTESVVPVTEQDFYNREKYSNTDQLMRQRTNDMKQNKFVDVNDWYKQKESKTKENSLERHYEYLREMEKAKKIQEKIKRSWLAIE